MYPYGKGHGELAKEERNTVGNMNCWKMYVHVARAFFSSVEPNPRTKVQSNDKNM
jgi:hypothetical protein